MDAPKNLADSKPQAERAKRFVLDAVPRCQSAQESRNGIWESCYLAYRNSPRYRAYQGRARLAIPEIYKAVETIYARVMRGLFPGDHWMRVMPREMADRDKAQKVESLLTYECERGRYRTRMGDFIKQGLIIGTSVAKVFWDFHAPLVRKKRVLETPFMAPGFEGGMQMVREEIESMEPDNALQGPRIRTVFRDQFLIPDLSCPGVQAEDGQPYVIEVFEVSEPELRRMADVGIYSKAAVKKVLEGGSDKSKETAPSLDTALAQARVNALGLPTEVVTHDEIPRYQLFEFWGEFPLSKEGGEIQECVIAVCGDHVLRIQENPFNHQKRPYVVGRWVNVPNEFDGIGVIEPNLSLWHELNDTRNQAMDFKTYALNPMLKVGAAANVSDQRFISGPGRILHCLNPDAIQTFDFNPSVAHLAMNMDQAIRTNIEESTGATRLLGGAETGTIDKATVYTGMVEQANLRILESMEALAWDAITPTLQMFWKLEQQFRDEAIAVRILGKSGASLRLANFEPADLMGEFDFLPVSGSRLSARWQENQLLQNFLGVAGQFLPPDVRLNIIERTWKVMGLDDGTVLFPETGFVQVMDPIDETALLLAGNAVPAHPNENHNQHLQVHALGRRQSFQSLAPEQMAYLDAHMAEHARFAGAQGQAPAQPYQPAANNGQAATGGPPMRQQPVGSSMAGGMGDVMGKQGAEAMFGMR